MTAALQPPPVEFAGDRLRVRFDRFDLAAYRLFLRCKALPESAVDVDRELNYTVTAPARFAAMLGVADAAAERPPLPLPPSLLDDQREIVALALAAERFAVWKRCGLGKTLEGLEFARQVCHLLAGRVLVVTLNEVVDQWLSEARKFYGDSLRLVRLATRAEMREWCGSGRVGGEPTGAAIGVTNYEKFNHRTEADQVVTEMQDLAGVVLDEGSRLRTQAGRQKWALIKSAEHVPYKLILTATPAPNDYHEYLSQAGFLNKFRSQDSINAFFNRDPKTHRWTVKRHARAAFFEWMASWSIYVDDPRRYGWRLDLPDVPRPVIRHLPIEPTEEQMAAARRLLAGDADGNLFLARETSAIGRMKLSQIAKGFRYVGSGRTRKVRRIRSLKPGVVADLVAAEAAGGAQVLVWTVFDAETSILADALRERAPGLGFDVLTGRTPRADRRATVDRFAGGDCRVLVSRASMLGFGLNFQCCTAMVFSGFTDGWEAWHQAIGRAVRFGQTEAVRVYMPLIESLEGEMSENLLRKQARHEAAIAEMETQYIRARRRLTGGAA